MNKQSGGSGMEDLGIIVLMTRDSYYFLFEIYHAPSGLQMSFGLVFAREDF